MEHIIKDIGKLEDRVESCQIALGSLREAIVGCTNDVEKLELQIGHNDTVVHGKIKGHKELTDKDILTLVQNIGDLSANFKKLVWTVGIALGGVLSSIILKKLGLM